MSWIFIFCCLIRSSSRSSGPSYIGIFILYGVAIFQFSVVSIQYSVKTTPSIFLCNGGFNPPSFFFFSASSVLSAISVKILAFRFLGFARRPANLSPLLPPPKHRLPYSFHRSLRYHPRLLRTRIQNLQHAFRIVLPLHAPLAHRRDPLDQILRHCRFAFDAPDSRCRAPLPHPLQPPRLFRREQFMPVIHRTHVRISRIRPPLPRRVRHHHFGLLSNLLIRLAQSDCVSITLRHLPPIQARYPRRLRQHHIRFRQNSL